MTDFCFNTNSELTQMAECADEQKARNYRVCELNAIRTIVYEVPYVTAQH